MSTQTSPVKQKEIERREEERKEEKKQIHMTPRKTVIPIMTPSPSSFPPPLPPTPPSPPLPPLPIIPTAQSRLGPTNVIDMDEYEDDFEPLAVPSPPLPLSPMVKSEFLPHDPLYTNMIPPVELVDTWRENRYQYEDRKQVDPFPSYLPLPPSSSSAPLSIPPPTLHSLCHEFHMSIKDYETDQVLQTLVQQFYRVQLMKQQHLQQQLLQQQLLLHPI